MWLKTPFSSHGNAPHPPTQFSLLVPEGETTWSRPRKGRKEVTFAPLVSVQRLDVVPRQWLSVPSHDTSDHLHLRKVSLIGTNISPHVASFTKTFRNCSSYAQSRFQNLGNVLFRRVQTLGLPCLPSSPFSSNLRPTQITMCFGRVIISVYVMCSVQLFPLKCSHKRFHIVTWPAYLSALEFICCFYGWSRLFPIFYDYKWHHNECLWTHDFSF